jgi:hypothetical protein
MPDLGVVVEHEQLPGAGATVIAQHSSESNEHYTPLDP